MGAIVDHLTGLRDKLVANGVRATTDPRNLNVPCVLLLPPSVVMDVACGGTATCQAQLITRPPGNLDAWKSLDDLLEQVSGVINVETVEPGSYTVDDQGQLPSYLIAWTDVLAWP